MATELVPITLLVEREEIGAFAVRDAILRHRRETGLPNRSRAVVTAVRLGIVASPSA